MSLLQPIMSLLVVIQLRFASCELVSSYVKFVIAMGENTPSWRGRIRICWGSVHILRNGANKCTECLDASHQYRLQSKQIQSVYAKCIRAPSPRKKDYKHCVRRFAWPRLWETRMGLQHSLLGNYKEKVTGRFERIQTTKLLNDLKSNRRIYF